MPAPSSTNNNNHWQDLAEGKTTLPSPQLTVHLSNNLWFGMVMGIGFCLGFLLSLMILIGLVGAIVYLKFPNILS